MRLVDTNICIPFLNGTDDRLAERFAETDDLHLCSVVKAELLYGARRSRRIAENLSRLGRFFRLFDSLPFDDLAADHYGVIRAVLAAAGTPIGGNDLQIASIALGSDATIVTRNQVAFERVPGLRVEVW